MAGYAFRSFDERKQIEGLWEAGTPAKEIAAKLNISISAFYTELRRGQDSTRLPDQRRRYDANLAQLRVQQSLERRGRKASRASMRKSTMEELEDRYRALCEILLILSLTREIGDEVRHDIAVQKAEAGIKTVCEEIEELKKQKGAERA